MKSHFVCKCDAKYQEFKCIRAYKFLVSISFQALSILISIEILEILICMYKTMQKFTFVNNFPNQVWNLPTFQSIMK